MEAVAGHIGSLQPLGELVREENVAQFAAAVLLVELELAAAQREVFLIGQAIQVHIPPSEGNVSHGHHAARPADLQPVQEQRCQQKVTEVIDSKDHPKAVVCLTVFTNTWKQKTPLREQVGIVLM